MRLNEGGNRHSTDAMLHEFLTKDRDRNVVDFYFRDVNCNDRAPIQSGLRSGAKIVSLSGRRSDGAFLTISTAAWTPTPMLRAISWISLSHHCTICPVRSSSAWKMIPPSSSTMRSLSMLARSSCPPLPLPAP